MIVSGRIHSVRKTTKYYFLDIIGKDKNNVQVILKKSNQSVRKGDILIAEVDIDKEKRNSYFVIKILNYIKSKNTRLLNERALRLKSSINHELRNTLIGRGFIEVDLPVLTFSETSSSANSFMTQYKVSKDNIYLRKNMDCLLRIIVANNIDKVFSIGHCFRNEYVTKTREPELEMLSVYANYYSLKDMINLAKEIVLRLALNKVDFIFIKYDEYKKISTKPKKNSIYVVTKYPISAKSNAKIDLCDKCLQEFRFIADIGTIIHGITEIDNQVEYANLCRSQNLKTYKGENLELYNLLSRGTAPCSSMGISINRLILTLSNEISNINDLEVFPFARIKQYKRALNALKK